VGHRAVLDAVVKRKIPSTSTWRCIGISFQLAIIAPRINLIGYDIATAQSLWKLKFYNIARETRSLKGYEMYFYL